MAATYTDNGGSVNGSNKVFTYSFPVLQTEDIKVALNGATQATTKYTPSLSPANITFNNTSIDSSVQESDGSPKTGVTVRVYRETTVGKASGDEDPKAVFAAGSSIRAGDLNANIEQALFGIHELQEQPLTSADIEDGAITTAKISADNITSALIADDQIDSEHYVDGSIDTAHIADAQVTHVKLANDCIDGDNIQNDVINSEHYAADSIDTEHYAPGSVDATALGTDSVTTAKIADDNVTLAKLGSGALPTDITVASANIVNDTIVDADVASGAAIAHTKLAGASGGKVLLGNSSNVVTATTVSGDVTINSSGVTVIGNDKIDSQHYVNGSIDLAHMSANSVDSDQYVDGSIDSAHIANDQVDSQHYAAGSIDLEHMSANSIDSDQYVDGSIDTVHIANDAVTSAKLDTNIAIDGTLTVAGGTTINDNLVIKDDNKAFTIKNGSNSVKFEVDTDNGNTTVAGTLDVTGAITGNVTGNADTATDLAAAAKITNSEQAAHSANDTTYFTTSASDARYFNVSTGDTIKDGDAFPDNDTTIATTAAINDRIIDLVDDVGGFVPIANELAFPNANPDVNNGAGTLVSIKTLSTNYTSNGSGVISISNGTVGNSTVTINGAENSTTYSSGYGMIVETTTTLNTYTFHRLVPKATEVTTVAGKATEIGRLGTAAAVEDLGILGTTAIVEDMSLLGTTACVADMALLGDSAVIADMATIADTSNLITNIGTVAGIQANVTTVATNNSNVTTVASNISSVNDFAARYRVGSNNPTSSLDTGDLFFNTTANELKVYNGSAWQGGVTASGNFASTTGNTFTGDNLYNDGVKGKFGTGSDLQIYHSSSDNNSYIQHTQNGTSLIVKSDYFIVAENQSTDFVIRAAAGTAELYFDNVKKFETYADGAKVHKYLVVRGLEAGDSRIYMTADEGDDNADWWLMTADTSGVWTLKNLASGSYETNIECNGNGNVELYFDNSKKLETSSAGVKINGELEFLTASDVNLTGANSHAVWDASASALELKDNTKLICGTGDDLNIYHESSSTTNWIEATNGDTKIQCTDGDIYLNPKAGEVGVKVITDGAVELYYNNSRKLYTDNGGLVVEGNLYLSSADNYKAMFGAGQDLKIWHDGSHSMIQHENTGNLYVICKSGQINFETGTEVMAQMIPNGGVKLRYNDSNKFETTNSGAQWFGNLRADDGNIIQLGDSNDLQIYHASGEDQIRGTGTKMEIRSPKLHLQNSGAENYLVCTSDGSVELYHDNVKKFETTGTGTEFTSGGNNTIKVNGTGSVKLYSYHDSGGVGWATGATSSPGELLYLDENSSRVQLYAVGEITGNFRGNGPVELYYDNSKKFETNSTGVWISGNCTLGADNNKLLLGTNQDLEIYHSGSDSFIHEQTKTLILKTTAANQGTYIQSNDAVWITTPAGAETMAKFAKDGDVKLYYDNSQKLATSSTGIWVSGAISGESVDLADSKKVLLGSGDDLEIFHDGSNSRIKDVGTGYLILNTDTGVLIKNGADNEGIAYFTPNGSVELMYDNSKKLETAGGGININGDVYHNTDGGSSYFGAGNDLRIYHDGSHNHIRNTVANQNILIEGVDNESGTPVIQLNPRRNQTGLSVKANQGVELYYDNNKKLDTVSDGIEIHAQEGQMAILYLTADEGDDNSDRWLTKATNGGGYHIQNYASGSWENNLVCATEDAVSLYYDNSLKLTTYSSGVKVYTPWDGNAALDVRIQNAQNGTATVVEFITDHYGGSRGTIGVTLSGTSYNTSSDYRLKENVTSLTGAITRVKNLSPKRFNFKEDTKTVDGFLAHEVSSVVPEAVTGDKDGSKMQQLDYSKLTTLTIAALQEALAKIETLETKVAALESS